jgi:hypothetical protein
MNTPVIQAKKTRKKFDRTYKQHAVELWLIIGAPDELEFLQGSKSQMDLSLIFPTDPTQLPKELAGVDWPPRE